MKGRDKRKRATRRRGDTGTRGNGVPLDRLRRCKVMVSLIDESTCNAEQRFQKSQEKNGCAACEHKEA